MSSRTPQQIADELNSLRAQAVTIVEGKIAGSANPGGSITFTYVNPIDGQPYTATGTAWNQCVPSKVSALKQSDGSWIVIGAHESAIVRESVHTDRRARPQPETGGKIKILYSKFEGGNRVFYLWGDRPSPRRIGSISRGVTLFFNQINNRGIGDKFIVGLRWQNDTTRKFSTQSLGDQNWLYADEPIDAPGYSRNDFYSGHGFWSSNSALPLPGYDPAKPPINYGLYRGAVQSFAATQSSSRYDAIRPIAPSITRAEFGNYASGFVTDFDFVNPIAVSQDYKSAIYNETIGTLASSTSQYKLASLSGDILLGGDIPALDSGWRDGNLIGSTYYQVQIPVDYSGSQWSVDVRRLSATTTKTTIRASVTYRHNSNQLVHSASYHP